VISGQVVATFLSVKYWWARTRSPLSPSGLEAAQRPKSRLPTIQARQARKESLGGCSISLPMPRCSRLNVDAHVALLACAFPFFRLLLRKGAEVNVNNNTENNNQPSTFHGAHSHNLLSSATDANPYKREMEETHYGHNAVQYFPSLTTQFHNS
jgi:hypothetical protein